ncbi:MAG: hypothetical protein HXS54_01325 [Theionarchaea archaeon]|nr:hypothetical protein [Theionarchaea archaeon]
MTCNCCEFPNSTRTCTVCNKEKSIMDFSGDSDVCIECTVVEGIRHAKETLEKLTEAGL